MYDYIEGNLVSKSPTQAVVAAGGVGYAFTIPLSTFEALPSSGSPAKVLAYLYVREDLLRLYGFATEAERRTFLQLISVSGIGPGIALAVLNGISVKDFRRAVASEQLTPLTQVKGIGRKTAERIILELKREMETELAEEPGPRAPGRAITSDAIAAMLALGYSRSASEAAVGRALDKLGKSATLEQIVRTALQET